MHICKHQVPCSATQYKPDHHNPLLYTPIKPGLALEMPTKETSPRLKRYSGYGFTEAGRGGEGDKKGVYSEREKMKLLNKRH